METIGTLKIIKVLVKARFVVGRILTYKTTVEVFTAIKVVPLFWTDMINFFKKLFKMQREVYMVDSNNLVATMLTRDYPESKWLFLTSIKDNSKVVLAIDSYVKNGNIYNLQTPKGHFVIQYK